MTDEVYSKLYPPTPTLADELCQCQHRPALKLMSALGYNPLHCLNCNLEVPPEQLALSTDLIEAVAAWRSSYDAIDRLWLDSGAYESWAKMQLADIHSSINQRGLALLARLNSSVGHCYYWYFQDETEPGFQARDDCPLCGAALSNYQAGIFSQRICEPCRIVTVGTG